MTNKLNSIRLLDKQKITYQVHEFPDTIHNAVEVAEYVGKPADMVYKTLVVLSTQAKVKPMLVMVAAEKQLNLKLVAKSVNEKKVQMASHEQAEKLTQLKVGGISALALLNRGFRVYIDEAAKDLESVLVSAGQRGINLEVTVTDLIRLTEAKWIKAS